MTGLMLVFGAFVVVIVVATFVAALETPGADR